MPQKIGMILTNNYNNAVLQQTYMASLQRNTAKAVNKSSSLKDAMIGRIHNVKPGCGSCGR
jgi:hypothetical protein